MKPEVTVLMSVFNCEEYLHESIESILGQTFSDFEFIIVNDGSTDKTDNIIKEFEDERIVYVKNKSNIGLSRSLNIGINKAKGKYIARIDADDIAVVRRLDIQYKFMKNNPEYGLTSSCISVINEKGVVKEEKCSYLNTEDIFYLLHFRNCIAHSSVMFKKEIVINENGYNVNIRFAQDYELWERLSKVTRFYEDKRILTFWRERAGSISAKDQDAQEEVVKQISLERINKIVHSKIDLKDISLIQNFSFMEINNIKTLNRALFILDEINSNIIKMESDTIKKLNFDLELLHNRMKKKSVDLLYSFFRARPFYKNIIDFLNLNLNKKWELLKEIFKRILGKFRSESQKIVI